MLYKGFVGTLGADYISHMVSDARVSPPEFARHYAEHLIYMPHTYVVNDYRQQAIELVARGVSGVFALARSLCSGLILGGLGADTLLFPAAFAFPRS